MSDAASPTAPPPLDVEALRAETPGCREVVHLNNAGAALPPVQVVDAVVDHLRLEATVGGYEAAAVAADAVDRCYGAIADLLGCRPDQVAFAESATRAWHAGFYGAAADLGPGDRILTGRAEYASNAMPLLATAARTGCELVVVPDDEQGQIDLDALADRLDERTKVVSLTHVPTNGGLVNPAEAVGEVIAASGCDALYLLDACQSAGQRVLDVEALRCDVLTATGRKYLRAPRGTGFLYVSDRALDRIVPPVVDLHSAEWTSPGAFTWRDDARRFEVWECAVAAKVGLGVAVDHLLAVGPAAVEARVEHLGHHLRRALAEQRGVTVHDEGRQRCGIVTFSVAGHDAAEVSARLRSEDRINTSVSVPASTLWDATERHLPTMVRASLHAYNTEAEADLLVEALRSPAR